MSAKECQKTEIDLLILFPRLFKLQKYLLFILQFILQRLIIFSLLAYY